MQPTMVRFSALVGFAAFLAGCEASIAMGDAQVSSNAEDELRMRCRRNPALCQDSGAGGGESSVDSGSAGGGSGGGAFDSGAAGGAAGGGAVDSGSTGGGSGGGSGGGKADSGSTGGGSGGGKADSGSTGGGSGGGKADSGSTGGGSGGGAVDSGSSGGGSGGGAVDSGSGGGAVDAGSGGSGGGSVGTLANIWIDLNGGSCTRAPSPAGYNDAAACASMQAAFALCMPGDTIIMKPGTYGAQSVSAVKASPGCTITGEPGVVIGALSTGGQNLTIENVTVDVGNTHGSGWSSSGSNITLNNVNVHGPFASIFISGGSYVTWHGGELGTAGVTGGKRSCNTGDQEPMQIQAADHVTLDGVRFHPQDFDSSPCPNSFNGFHLEMVRIDYGVSNLTMKNSTFDDGDHSNTASVFITNVNTEPGDPANLVFQNNFFGTNNNNVFSVHQNVGDCSTFTFAYNTFHNTPGDLTVGSCGLSSASQWIGNLGPRPGYYACSGTHTKNVWQHSNSYTCGTDTVVIGAQFSSDALGLGGADGFHLQVGSPALGAGEVGGYCTGALGGRDHDGDSRPTSGPCDVGADER